MAQDLWFSLHTADPGDLGYRPRNELAYQGYKRRKAAERKLCLVVEFPACVEPAVSLVATHWAVCHADGELRMAGEMYPHISISSGVTPQLICQGTLADIEMAIGRARELRGWRGSF
jgi:hypothetical protein